MNMVNDRQEEIFVGRRDEIAQFKAALDDARSTGLTVLVVGQAGMGKSALLREFRREAEDHDFYDCSTMHFRVDKLYDPELFLERLLLPAFGLMRHSDGRSIIKGPNWQKQVSAVLGTINADKMFDSVFSGSPKRPWQQLIEFFEGISKNSPSERRFVFFIDPEKYLREDSGDAWLPIVDDLPGKFMLVFAQRPEDALTSNRDIKGRHVRRIPDGGLGALSTDDAEEFIDKGLTTRSRRPLGAEDALRRYNGWPYAIDAGLRLLREGKPATALPKDPDQLAGSLLDTLGDRYGTDGLRFINAVRVLEVGGTYAPLPALREYLGVETEHIDALLSQPFVRSLASEVEGGLRLFHSLLADEVKLRLEKRDDWKERNQKAVEVYEARLEEDERDELALRRLAGHVREALGDEAWVSVVNALFQRKHIAGMWTECIAELEAVLPMTTSPVQRGLVYSNLGIVYSTRGDLDAAEEMYRKSLAVDEELGRKEGMAAQYGNLGLLYATRGDLDAAEEMYRKGLAIDEELGRKEGMAFKYGNLGSLYWTRGDLDAAEEMYRKALAIAEDMGNKEAIASLYGNLGVLYKTRGDLDAAEEMYRKSLAIAVEMGSKKVTASMYGNLGILYKTRGDLDAAEEMYRKGLAIDEEMGRKEGMASKYANLGNVYQTRGDLDAAGDFWVKSADLFRQLGNVGQAEEIEGWIANLRKAPEGEAPDGEG